MGYAIAASVLGIGLFYFILNRALSPLRHKTRGLINLIAGLIMTGGFVWAFVSDYQGGNIFEYPTHLFFLGASFLYSVSISLYLLLYRAALFSKNKVTSKSYYQEYLYVIGRNGQDLYLFEDKQKYHGLLLKLKKTDFHDEVIRNFERKNNLCVIKEEEVVRGKITFPKQKKMYHCYMFTIKEGNVLTKAKLVPGLRLGEYQIDDFDREIILRLMLNEPFDIEK
ncbi:MAG TPA: hypothetical protein DD618_02025 [Acholeplasmatales bacterium]|nr:hypothetical protein [Acholeplasmatales bacterium]